VAETVESWEEPYSSASTLTPQASCARCGADHKPRRLMKQPKRGSRVMSAVGNVGIPPKGTFVVVNRLLLSPPQHGDSPQGSPAAEWQ